MVKFMNGFLSGVREDVVKEDIRLLFWGSTSYLLQEKVYWKGSAISEMLGQVGLVGMIDTNVWHVIMSFLKISLIKVSYSRI